MNNKWRQGSRIFWTPRFLFLFWTIVQCRRKHLNSQSRRKDMKIGDSIIQSMLPTTQKFQENNILKANLKISQARTNFDHVTHNRGWNRNKLKNQFCLLHSFQIPIRTADNLHTPHLTLFSNPKHFSFEYPRIDFFLFTRFSSSLSRHLGWEWGRAAVGDQILVKQRESCAKNYICLSTKRKISRFWIWIDSNLSLWEPPSSRLNSLSFVIGFRVTNFVDGNSHESSSRPDEIHQSDDELMWHNLRNRSIQTYHQYVIPSIRQIGRWVRNMKSAWVHESSKCE